MRTFSQAQALIAKSVLLDSRLALFHEEERWLAIADLHFGFELSQRVVGRLVPFWGMESIETRLCQLLRDYHPATLILLGDLIQFPAGCADQRDVEAAFLHESQLAAQKRPRRHRRSDDLHKFFLLRHGLGSVSDCSPRGEVS